MKTYQLVEVVVVEAALLAVLGALALDDASLEEDAVVLAAPAVSGAAAGAGAPELPPRKSVAYQPVPLS
jgi:hypothetical protein